MCQLTYLQFPQTLTTGQFKLIQGLFLKLNSEEGHKDGFGYLIPKGDKHLLVRNGTCASLISNLYKNMKIDKDSNWTISHVRKASTIVQGKLGAEFNHPFKLSMEGKSDLYGAHNGTLKNDMELAKDEIDSLLFFRLLYDKLCLTSLDFVNAFEETYEEFYGKCAFIIRYDGDTYIIRGKTATLHRTNVKIDGKPAGFIVNTERKPILNVLTVLNEVLAVSGKDMSYETISMLPINTIYHVQNETATTFESAVININSTFKELEFSDFRKRHPVQKPTVIQTPNSQVSRSYRQRDQLHVNNLKIPKDLSVFDKLETIIEETALSIFEFDMLFQLFYEHPIIEATLSDFTDFVNSVLIPITRLSSGNRRKTWLRLLEEQGLRQRVIYKEMPFLYLLSTPKELKRYFKNIERNRQNRER